MDKSSVLVWGGVILAVVIGIGQESEQSWKLRPNGDSDYVQFTVHRFKPGNSWTWSQGVPFARFHNLSPKTLEDGGRAEFEYVTDAGKLVCKGSFSFHSGAGSFVFVPNPQFAAGLRDLGYGSPTQEQSMDMLISDVSLEFARSVRDAGLHASTGQLLDLRHHGVNREYLSELKGEGYEFTANDIVQLKDHGVNTDFLRDLMKANYHLTAGQIVQLRDHGIGSDFVHDLRSLGLHPHASDLVQFRDHGVSADFLGDLKAAGYDELNADQIVALREHGVPADFAQQAHELGYKFTPQELIELHNHGVSAEYLKTLKESGIRPLTAEQIQKLREHGVD
jgi:hypothetical protein